MLVFDIIIILMLLFLSAFFSGSELAMMALDPISLETRVRSGSLLARLQAALRGRPQRFLSTILIGYNVANIGLTAFVTSLAIRKWSHLTPPGMSEPLGESMTLTISTVLVTIAILIFAELMPKTIAAIDTLKIANMVTVPMYVMDVLFTPLNIVIEKAVMPLIDLITGKRRENDRYIVDRADVKTAISLAHAGGKLHSKDVSVAYQALHLSSRTLADIMTPRVDLVAVPEGATVGEALTLMTDTGFTRLPVYEDSYDNIFGVLLLKDLVQVSLRAAQSGRDPEDRWAQLPARSYRRDVAHLPETKSAVDTLGLMQKERVHLVVVADEHGGTAGIVTMEDILEELVGEIQDESDIEQAADVIRHTPEFTIVTGRARLDQVPALDEMGLEAADSTTTGGLMMELLGRPVVKGDVVELEGVRLTALKVLHNRIKLLRVDHPQHNQQDGN